MSDVIIRSFKPSYLDKLPKGTVCGVNMFSPDPNKKAQYYLQISSDEECPVWEEIESPIF